MEASVIFDLERNFRNLRQVQHEPFIVLIRLYASQSNTQM